MKSGEARIAMALVLIAAYAGFISEFAWQAIPTTNHESIQVGFTVFAGMMTLFIAYFALVAARRSADASEKQVETAIAQTEAARAQSEAAKIQTVLLSATLKEQVRPVPIIERFHEDKDWNDQHQMLLMRNAGTGPMLDVTVDYIGKNGEALGRYEMGDGAMIPPGQTALIPAEVGEFSRLIIHYRCIRGDGYLSAYAVAKQPLNAAYAECAQKPPGGGVFKSRLENHVSSV